MVVAIASNQLPFTEALEQTGHLQLLGDAANVSVEQIRGPLLEALQAPWPLSSGHGLTDGWGFTRLATAMLCPQLLL